MTETNIREARRCACQLIERCDVLLTLKAHARTIGEGTEHEFKTDGLNDALCGSRESGAVRRASMELTRALANLRRAR